MRRHRARAGRARRHLLISKRVRIGHFYTVINTLKLNLLDNTESYSVN